ncbi:ABC transporter ATP-binding protein [Ideonella sp.]|uniref:ABC transporter ATP-binding protein n=1 Tax=Ideonella sp. TaxID=1929293 RepID=UPI002B4787EF|nr:ABC transporter ATP-binding protein [Ideonella sp.]HJV71710.1 ABC transporter ATP-binding protein [Ideonella sp.]
MASLKLRGLRKEFQGHPILHGIDLEVADGEFVVLVGPSGCGKSTLLRCVAGLEEIDGGELLIGERVVNHVPPAQRGLAMVFQSYALYPHMTVAENLSFGLRMAGKPKAEIDAAVARAAETLQITHLLARKPAALSGGQRQRVAIGRAIVRQPGAFLFDEPLSNLDAALRGQMRIELARLHAELKSTTLYVTHDQAEAMTLADRVVVLNAGRVEQVGAPMALYREPANLFVAGFLGSPRINLLPGALLGEPQVPTLGARPEHLVVRAGEGPGCEATVIAVEPLGDVSYLHLRAADGTALIARVAPDTPATPGQALRVDAAPAHRLRFGADGRRLSDN